jgi:hypothetical protein
MKNISHYIIDYNCENEDAKQKNSSEKQTANELANN